MSHISLRIDTDLDERLDRYAERHHLENRSQAIRHALRSMLNLEEGETVALRPVAAKKPGSMKSKASKRVVKKGAPLALVDDLEEGRKIIERNLTPKHRPEPAEDCPVSEEDEAEYFARIQRENEQRARGVGPDPW